MTRFLLAFAALFIITGCFDKKEKKSDETVITSTFSLYDAVKHITKDTVKVKPLVPFSKEIHEFEPTPKDIIALKKAKLVIINGAGLEPWLKKYNLKSNILDVSKDITLLKFDEKKEDEHHHHDESGTDPHYWLDINNQITVAKEIEKKLEDVFPKKKSIFRKNLKEYTKKLKELDKLYQTSLSKCKKHTIIVNHNAFNYLAKRYGFSSHSLSGLSPESMPSAKTMKKLIDELKEHNLDVVFYESFGNKNIISQIAKDTNAKVMVLNPLANITKEEAQKGMTYTDIMKENLKKLKEAMKCD